MSFFDFKTTFFDSNQFILTDSRFEIISKFMFGLFNPKTYEIFKKIYPNICKPTGHMKQLEYFATKLASTITKEASIQNDSTLVRVCCWAYETQDAKFGGKLADRLPEILNLNFSDVLRASDILSLCYIIKARKKTLKLRIFVLNNGTNFIINPLQLFSQTRHTLR